MNEQGIKYNFQINSAQFKSQIKDCTSSLSTMKSALSAIKSTLATVISVKTIVNAVKQITELGDSIDKTSQKVGQSKKSFQEWSYVAARCGVSSGALETAMKRLTKDNLSFDKTVEELQNMDNAAERNAKAFELFGKNAAELYPILNMTNEETDQMRSKASSLGGVLSTSVVRAAAALKDSVTDMKTAFNGLLGVLGEKFLPLIRQAVDWLTQLIVRAQQFFKIVFGMENTVESVDISSGMSDYVEETEDAIGETKKLLAVIGGFDELNILKSNEEDGGSSGGSGGNSLNIPGLKDGIEKSELDFNLPDSWKKAAEWLKENLDLVLAIGEAFALWKISSSLVGTIFNIIQALREVGTLGTGISLILTGLTLETSGVIGLAKNGMNTADLFKTLVGQALAVTGATLIWGAAGLLISLPLTMTLALVGLALSLKGQASEEAKAALQQQIQNVTDQLELKAEVELIITQTIETVDDLNAKFKTTKKFVDELFSLTEKDNKTAEEIERIKTLVDLINDSGLLGDFKLAWDESTQSINATKKEVEELMQVTLKEMKIEAYRNAIIEIYKKQAEAEQDLIKYEEERKVLQAQLEEAENKRHDAYTAWQDAVAEYNQAIQDGMDESSVEAQKMMAHVQELSKAYNDTCAEVNTYNEALDENNTAMEQAKINIQNFDAEAQTMYNRINDVNTGTETLINNLWKLNGKTFSYEVVAKYVDHVNNNVDYVKDQVNKYGGRMPTFASGGVVNKPTIAMVGEYSGASSNPEIVTPENKMREVFAESNGMLGEIFVAVGRQIVSAIQEQDNSVVIGDDVIARAAARGNKSYQMRTGVSLI